MSVVPANDTAIYTDETGRSQAAPGVALVSSPGGGVSTRTVPSMASSDTGTTLPASGTATLAFSNTQATELINSSSSSIWARWGAAAAVNGAGSFEIKPGGTFTRDRVAGTLNLLNASSSTASAYTVNRYTPS